MRLLLDENLSPRLVVSLADVFPGSNHVRNLGLKIAADPAVWDFAKLNGYVIVSKDDDFRQLSFTYGHPPKVIGILTGNCPTAAVELILRASHALIGTFLADPQAAYLALP